MTLNPGAAAFVPSVETLRLAKKSPALCVSVEEGEDIKKINFTPKIQTNNFVETYGYHQFVEDDLVLDYSNFDVRTSYVVLLSVECFVKSKFIQVKFIFISLSRSTYRQYSDG